MPEARMGAMQLSDELQRMIERQVAEGRAASPMAFLEEAVMRLIDDAGVEETAIRQAAAAGLSDIDAGRYTAVITPEDGIFLHERLMAKVRSRLAADE
jgi:predicted transcriptional regulator